MIRIPERYLPKVDSEWYKRRLLKMLVLILPVFFVLGFRLMYLQIAKGEYFREISSNNCLRVLRNEPLRGQIFDREGNLLVDNRPAFDLHIVPEDAKPVADTVEKLAEHIPMSSEEIMEIIRKSRGPYGYRSILIKKDIGRDLMGLLLGHRYDLPGIVIYPSPRRSYINNKFAAHVIGYLGEISPSELASNKFPIKRGGDMVGRYGTEKAYESELSGNPGRRIVQVNATGQIMKVLADEPAEPGYQLNLTIDSDLQRKAESFIKESAGAIVAIDPRNGDVLALASSPSYDQNAFINGISGKEWHKLINHPDRPMRNKAIQGEYPPASTFKIITAMAALEEGLIDENTQIFCPGHYRYGNRYYRCWKTAGHGEMDIYDALSESCDVFFYQLGKLLGVDRIAWYAMACGLGAETGIDLGHEANGNVPTAAWKKKRIGVPWQPGETLSISIGQGYNLTTPLQMAVVISGIANNGEIYRPQVMKSMQTVEGVVVRKPRPEIMRRMPASERTLEIIKEGLRRVVNDRKGTAYRYARSPDVEISGKTGTAQVISRRLDLDFDDDEESEEMKKRYLPHAWFVGFAPLDSPRIAVSVLVEHGESGSSGAGPIAKEIMIAYLNKLGHKIGDDRDDVAIMEMD